MNECTPVHLPEGVLSQRVAAAGGDGGGHWWLKQRSSTRPSPTVLTITLGRMHSILLVYRVYADTHALNIDDVIALLPDDS